MAKYGTDGTEFKDSKDAKTTIKDRLVSVKNMMLMAQVYQNAAEQIVFSHTKSDDGTFDRSKLLEGHAEYSTIKDRIKEDFEALRQVEELEYGPFVPHIRKVSPEDRSVLKKHFPRTEELLERIGKDDFLDDLNSKIQKAREDLQNTYLPKVLSDVVKPEHKEHALDYILEDLGVNKSKVASYKLELMRNQISTLVTAYISNDKAKDVIKRQYDL